MNFVIMVFSKSMQDEENFLFIFLKLHLQEKYAKL